MSQNTFLAPTPFAYGEPQTDTRIYVMNLLPVFPEVIVKGPFVQI